MPTNSTPTAKHRRSCESAPPLTQSRPLSPEDRPPRTGRSRIRHRRRNRQLNLGAEFQLTPHRQLSADKFRAFPHARQSVMSHAAARLQNLRINSFTVVPDAHPQLALVITDFDVNPSRARVVKRIADPLAGDAVHLVPQDRVQIARLTFHLDAEVYRR